MPFFSFPICLIEPISSHGHWVRAHVPPPACSLTQNLVQRHRSFRRLEGFFQNIQALMHLFWRDDNGWRNAKDTTKTRMTAQVGPQPKLEHPVANPPR